jgi:hypothetical protein
LLMLWFVPRSALMVHLSADSGFDLGGLLSALPALAAVTLLAPLVGYRKRDAVLMIVPGANVYIAWVIGCRAAGLAESSARAGTAALHERIVAGPPEPAPDRK